MIIFLPTDAMLPSSIEETSNKPYSNWDENANALLAGIVHGVVVQIKILAPLKSLSPFKIGKLTHIVGDACSRYSTSASAKAVFSTTDHITGFEPIYRSPFIKNLWNSSTIAASEENSIVVYGLSQLPKTPNLINWSF